MSNAEASELLELTQKLLDCITLRDWPTYQLLCDPTLSAFEPEACGQLVEGMEFHQFYFAMRSPAPRSQTTMASPRVRMLGSDAAVVTYVRLVQYEDDAGKPGTACFEETRIWQRQQGEWRHVHFHRSAAD